MNAWCTFFRTCKRSDRSIHLFPAIPPEAGTVYTQAGASRYTRHAACHTALELQGSPKVPRVISACARCVTFPALWEGETHKHTVGRGKHRIASTVICGWFVQQSLLHQLNAGLGAFLGQFVLLISNILDDSMRNKAAGGHEVLRHAHTAGRKGTRRVK